MPKLSHFLVGCIPLIVIILSLLLLDSWSRMGGQESVSTSKVEKVVKPSDRGLVDINVY